MRGSVSSFVLLAVAAVLAWGVAGIRGTTAQDAASEQIHPFVGTWVVDTLLSSDSDSPEIAIVTPDGRLAGLGANRVAGGTWEAVDAQSAMLTLVTVFDQGGDGGYAVIRGPHLVDSTGNAWTCECTVTIVGADGTVRDAIRTQAVGRRLPLQGPEALGEALSEVPVWSPAPAPATPAA